MTLVSFLSLKFTIWIFYASILETLLKSENISKISGQKVDSLISFWKESSKFWHFNIFPSFMTCRFHSFIFWSSEVQTFFFFLISCSLSHKLVSLPISYKSFYKLMESSSVACFFSHFWPISKTLLWSIELPNLSKFAQCWKKLEKFCQLKFVISKFKIWQNFPDLEGHFAKFANLAKRLNWTF